MPKPPAAAAASPHRWSFYRAGGVDQVRFRTGDDVLRLDELDQQLWVALSCPVKGLEIDEKTLAALDSDSDSHVRPPEILAAVRWLREALRSGDCLLAGKDGVALADLRTDSEEGRSLRASAEYILKSLKKPLDAITIDDAAKVAEVYASALRNGDGVVPSDAVADAAARKIAEELLECVGGVADRSGKPGFDQTRLDAFFQACSDFDAWHKAGETGRKDVFAFGEATSDAWATLAAVRCKVDDYFGRCRIAAFDPRALAAVNREEDAYMAAAAKDLTITAGEVAHFPLALVAADKPLPLGKGVNPAWAAPVAALRAACCPTNESLTEAEWVALCAKLEPYGAWLQKKAGVTIEKSRERTLPLPVIDVKGASSTAEGFPAAMAVLSALPGAVRSQVDRVAATTTDDVTLFLNPTGSRVIWGGPEDAALKARVLSALIANYPLGSVTTYDVSAPNSAVVS
jgi:hypothetical protein